MEALSNSSSEPYWNTIKMCYKDQEEIGPYGLFNIKVKLDI